MSHFDEAIKSVLVHEGGWCDYPEDPGGETNFGISMMFIRNQGLTAKDLGLADMQPGCLRKLSLDTAKALYRKYFWDPFPYDKIDNYRIAAKLFDTAVNISPRNAHRMLQRVLGDDLKVDGVLGPKTISATNAATPDLLLASYCQAHADYYKALAARKPEMKIFLKGWLERARWPLS
jgi:type VI secretion system secreted protein VgrG